MSISQNHKMTAEDYDRLAWEYYRTLPLEHFMESTPQATQREIVLAGLALIKAGRPDFQYFSELLIQYWHEGELRRVVPDNMAVLGGDVRASRSSYALDDESAPVFLVIEYVSSSSEGKDYVDSLRKYEQELRVPYCVMYYPERHDLRVHRHDGEQYMPLEPAASGRVEIPELGLEIGLLDGWMRFWRQGRLLELPADLARQLDEQTRRLQEQTRVLQQKTKQLEQQSKQLAQQSQQLDQKTQVIENQAEQLRETVKDRDHAKSQLAALTDWLRRQVRERAAGAGRSDLIEASVTADANQLQRWLDELP
jgi:Uma2 family endonuclease